MKLLVAVVPYLGHNSAYVRGTEFFFLQLFFGGFSRSLKQFGVIHNVSMFPTVEDFDFSSQSELCRGTASLGFYELIEAAKAKGVFEVAGDACNRLCCCGLEITKIHSSYLIVQGFDELLAGCFWNCMAFWP